MMFCFYFWVAANNKGNWIGGNDFLEPGIYRWVLTGQQVELPESCWRPDEPKTSKHCLKMAGPSRDRLLQTERCRERLNVFCEQIYTR